MAKRTKSEFNPIGLKVRKTEKRNKGSSTPGRIKGCVASPEARIWARRGRSYKNPNYNAMCAKKDGSKGARG